MLLQWVLGKGKGQVRNQDCKTWCLGLGAGIPFSNNCQKIGYQDRSVGLVSPTSSALFYTRAIASEFGISTGGHLRKANRRNFILHVITLLLSLDKMQHNGPRHMHMFSGTTFLLAARALGCVS